MRLHDRARLWLAPLVPVVILGAGLGGAHCSKDDGNGTAASSAPPAGSAGAGGAGGGGDCAGKNPLGNVYWGDLHVHTSYSFDAFLGANRSTPSDAYAFAKGKTQIPIAAADPSTINATIDRPLDFLAVTDHSEFLSIAGECILESDQFGKTPFCQTYTAQGTTDQMNLFYGIGLELAFPKPAQPLPCQGDGEADCRAAAATSWGRVQEAAKSAYDRCSFTTLIAYEWTAQTGQANLHRNVVFGTDRVPASPADYLDYPTPLALWQQLEKDCRAEDGCDVITIPHNSNSSGGRMWDTAEDPAATPYMKRYQTLVEMYQHKGNSECLPGDALADPECAFEQLTSSFIGQLAGIDAGLAVVDAGAGMVRNGLADGLKRQAASGDNPLAMGVVGATDTHNATPGNAREDTWPGHVGIKDDSPERRLAFSDFSPGGITGVWAPQNTREDVFAAFKRRETFATSGPRIPVRFYAAAGLDDAAAQKLCDDPSFPRALLAAGAVPMGGTLKTSSAPHVFVAAMKDQNPLDAVDIVKLSSDATTPTHEIFHRDLGADGGDHACVVFTDATYDASRPTLYYARVFEKPSWRWSHYDCQQVPNADGGVCTPAPDSGLPPADVQIRERAWTSPIWLAAP